MSAAPRRSGMMSLAIGNGTAQAAALLRYTLLARLLGPEQLGLAAILILTSQFFEQITDAGVDRFLVQSRGGNTRSVNQAVHALLIARGLTIGGLMALSSGLLSHFFHHPELRDGLLLLAIAPAVFGFSHYDFRRVQRHHRFGPEGVVTTVSELTSLVAIVVAALATHSFVAVSLALIARSAAAAITSHLVARRPYRLGYSREHAPAMMAFGLPLMLNGMLLFLTGQGDRLFIGNQLGATELGHYSAAILLIFYPATMLSRMLQSVNLPIIAAARDAPDARRAVIGRVAGQSVLLAMAMALGFALLAPVVVPLLYGKRFALPALLLGLIGALQAARFVRLWPVTVALATGHSRAVLWNSVARLVAFPLAVALGAVLGGLAGVVVAFILAEFVASGVSMLVLHRHGLGTPARDWARLLVLAAWIVALAAVMYGVAASATALAGGLVLGAGALVAAIAGDRVALRSLVTLPARLLRQRRA